MDNLIIVTPFWQRPEVSKIFWQNINDLDLRVIACCSPEDKENIELAREHAVEVVLAPNVTGIKWQKGVDKARQHIWDYMMILGSDDLVSKPYLETVKNILAHGEDYIGLEGAVGVSLQTKKFRYWEGYQVSNPKRQGESAGAGRVLTRTLIEKLNWNLFPAKTRGMDNPMHLKILSLGYKHALVRDKGEPLCLAVKSEETLTPMKEYPFIHDYDLTGYYSQEVINMINQFK